MYAIVRDFDACKRKYGKEAANTIAPLGNIRQEAH